MRWIALMFLSGVLLLTAACEEEEGNGGEAAPTATAEVEATATLPPEPSNTPLPPTPTPEPVVLSGVGQTATDPVQLPSPISVATLMHEGSSNFAVWLYQDGQRLDLLVNEIGRFQGRRPLIRSVDPDRPVVFDIEADGPWTIRLDPLGFTSSAALSGRGADVSGLFDPPQSGPWEFLHDGQSNFGVWLHCLGGSDLIQNEIGPVSGSRIVEFADGPCFWEVEADGSWSLTPR